MREDPDEILKSQVFNTFRILFGHLPGAFKSRAAREKMRRGKSRGPRMKRWYVSQGPAAR